jgi:high-affinity iron transporter
MNYKLKNMRSFGARRLLLLFVLLQLLALAPVVVAVTDQTTIEPFWQEKVDEIHVLLQEAIQLYKEGESSQAKKMVLKAQYDGYKNSLMETAVRRNVSSSKDYRNNSDFVSLVKGIDDRQDIVVLEKAAGDLVASILSDLPGLPIIEGALSKKDERRLTKLEEETVKDWNADVRDIQKAFKEATVLYGNGEQSIAIQKIKDVYFTSFEESGLAEKIAGKDIALRADLETGFSKVVRLMEHQTETDLLSGEIQKMMANLSSIATGTSRTLSGGTTGGMNVFLAVIVMLGLLLTSTYMIKKRRRAITAV